MSLELPPFETNLEAIYKAFKEEKGPTAETDVLLYDLFTHLRSVYEAVKVSKPDKGSVVSFMQKILFSLRDLFLDGRGSFGVYLRDGVDIQTLVESACGLQKILKKSGKEDELKFLGEKLSGELEQFNELYKRLQAVEQEKKAAREVERRAEFERKDKRKRIEEANEFQEAMLDPRLKDEFKVHVMSLSHFLTNEVREGRAVDNYLNAVKSLVNFVNIMRADPEIGRLRFCFRCFNQRYGILGM